MNLYLYFLLKYEHMYVFTKHTGNHFCFSYQKRSLRHVLVKNHSILCLSVNLRSLFSMQKQDIDLNGWEGWVKRCKCCLTWSKEKEFIVKPQLQMQIFPDERYPRCSECLKFYMDRDWLKRYMKEDEDRERDREENQKAGHPLYQPGAKYAPRRAKDDGIK